MTSQDTAVSEALARDLLHGAPAPLRKVLHSALRLDALDRLYCSARGGPHGQSLCGRALKLLDIRINIEQGDIARIPASGPLLIVANHPFGLLDGMIVESLLMGVRRDFKILANERVAHIPEAADRIIAVDVFGGSAAATRNARGLRAALEWVKSGHVLVIFPAGEVSHWAASRQARIEDRRWSDLPVRIARRSGATVLPLYFNGANSLGFQLSGLLHPALRTVWVPAELMNKRGSSVTVRIGTPVKLDRSGASASDSQAADYLRARTYLLAHRDSSPSKRHDRARAVAQAETAGLTPEMERLRAAGRCISETGNYAVYTACAQNIPLAMREIGRLRELTFRDAGEGTGNTSDLDRFDSWYTHLLLWHKRDKRIAGAYRLAWTADVLARTGVRGLYTSTLFRFNSRFFATLGSAVELGRSFIRAEYQRDYAALLSLWQGISRLVAQRPDAPVLFGPVSISGAYAPAAREIMVEYLRKQHFRQDLARHVQAKAPFRAMRLTKSELAAISGLTRDLNDLDSPLGDVDHKTVPVLLRQYLKLGGELAGFNTDRNFSDALDGLIIVDLRRAPERQLRKYMGENAAAEFLAAHAVTR